MSTIHLHMMELEGYSNACARFVSCGLISCFIVGEPFCPYQFGRKIRVLSVPKRKPNVDNYMDIIKTNHHC